MLTPSGVITGPYRAPAVVEGHVSASTVALLPSTAVELATGPRGGQIEPSDAARATPRIGYDSDVPRGGTGKLNPGGDYPGGLDRWSFMAECYAAYLACPWLSAPIDATASTATAGGVVVEPDDTATDSVSPDLDDAPPQVRKLDALFRYCNPDDDIVQLFDGVSADLDIYGDSFTEVVYCLGEPVALYPLDAATMGIDADEHGVVRGYWQVSPIHGAPVYFEPEQIIHVSERSPRGGLYGVGFVQKAFWSATTWLFAAGLLKERMRKGDPPDLHIDAPVEQQDNEYKRWVQQYRAHNLGAANIGNPITTKGGFTIAELRAASRADLVAIKTHCRDEMVSQSGTPPNQVGIIESGNLGGGTGTSQWRTYMLNRVAPRRKRIAEKFNFRLLAAFGIDGWRMAFREVDYADDETQETIYTNRMRAGVWSLNEARKAINLPPVDGGDDHVMVERSWVMSWDKMQDFSDSWVVKNGGVNYPGHTADGFPPVNPNAPIPPGAPGLPAPGSPDPGATPAVPSPDGDGSNSDDVPSGNDPDDDDADTTSTGPRGRARAGAGAGPAEAWLDGITEHYAALLRRPQ